MFGAGCRADTGYRAGVTRPGPRHRLSRSTPLLVHAAAAVRLGTAFRVGDGAAERIGLLGRPLSHPLGLGGPVLELPHHKPRAMHRPGQDWHQNYGRIKGKNKLESSNHLPQNATENCPCRL